MTRPVVLIESPFSNGGLEAVRYLFCALLDSVLRGEAPIASHAMYPLCLPEHCGDYDGKTGREVGLACRDALAQLRRVEGWNSKTFLTAPEISVVAYVDIGESSGMSREVGPVTERRKLQGEALRIWEAGEWPSKTRWSSTNQ